MEHNGDVFSCDHYVEPNYLLGNIQSEHMLKMVASKKQRQFGEAKLTALPQYCRQCEVRFACHGGCPKNRFIHTPDGEPDLNYLCAGYKAFFHHIDKPMKMMAMLINMQRPPAEIMGLIDQLEVPVIRQSIEPMPIQKKKIRRSRRSGNS